MSDSLVFMMGKFEASFPRALRYAKNHLWAREIAPGRLRFGFSAYAVRLLQDVYFLEWTVDAPSKLRERQAIGQIESSKAESELYAPCAGTVETFNAELLSDPSAINVNCYEEGWLFEMSAGAETLLDAEAYLVHLKDAWAVAERTIKGQVNDS